MLVLGADSSALTRREIGDQLCIAVGRSGLVGLARKILPTDLDTRACARPLVPGVRDSTSRRRFVDLPNGSRACLNSCYDLFGALPASSLLARRCLGLRRLYEAGDYLGGRDRRFRTRRAEMLGQWAGLLQARAPDVALVAIHGFRKPGRGGYWQRHGIAAASAGLGGSLVVGAAHFGDALRAGSRSPRAADRVPRSHLALGPHRPASRLRPLDSFVATTHGLAASVRLFTRR